MVWEYRGSQAFHYYCLIIISQDSKQLDDGSLEVGSKFNDRVFLERNRQVAMWQQA